MPLVPCCARFKRFGDRWLAFTGAAGGGPVDPLQLVIEAPEFLGMAGTQPLPRAAMVAPQSLSNRVLVVVDEAGGVQLAACPQPGVGGGLAALVGELLAAGGGFWHQKYDALAGPFEQFLGMSLADWIAVRVGEGWSADKFRAGVELSLNEGKFPINIVVGDLDPIVQETVAYLKNMNLNVRVIGHVCQTYGGDEVVRPRVLSEERAAPELQPTRPQPWPSETQFRAQAPQWPQPAPQPTKEPQSQAGPARTVSAAPQQPEKKGFPPLPPSDATPRQKEILTRLIQLDTLGLVRKGFEYYLPPSAQKAATATIVLAADPDRWPFARPEEVIVVVNTGPDHLSGYLKIAPNEVEEFLGSLPRADRKEHKGSLLLRAASINEAAQIVNELRALKEVSAGSIG